MDKAKREYLENRRREYLDERKSLIELEWRGGDSFVRTMTTLSAGALGLSLAFVEKLAPAPHPYTLGYVRGAWIAFALSLALILAGHLTSQHSMRRQRDIVDRDWEDQARSVLNPDAEKPDEKPRPANNRCAPITSGLYVLALAAFVVATALLAAFSWLNLPGA